MARPLVSIVMGSKSDLEVMAESARVLDRFGVPYELEVLSAHRSPDRAAEFARQAAGRGLRVLIAGAGGAAHLAGALAAGSILPVIGVPLASSELSGLDALLATVQMPGGVPVATVAIGKAGAKNAALLSVQILAGGDAALRKKLEEHKAEMAREISSQSEKARKELSRLLSSGKKH